jgi:hypothetical protein
LDLESESLASAFYYWTIDSSLDSEEGYSLPILILDFLASCLLDVIETPELV